MFIYKYYQYEYYNCIRIYFNGNFNVALNKTTLINNNLMSFMKP